MLLVGTYERQLDEKGRLALPAPFRTLLGEHCYLAKGMDKCIEVIPADVFERDALDTMEAVKRGELTRSRRRTLAGTAALVAIDRQGRVKLDDTLRVYAELALESPVAVAGNFDRLEIWEPARRRDVESAGDDDLAGASG